MITYEELDELVIRAEHDSVRRVATQRQAHEIELDDMARWGQLNVVRLVEEIRKIRQLPPERETELLAIIKARVGDMQCRDEEIKRLKNKLGQNDDEWEALIVAKHQGYEEIIRLTARVNKLVKRLRVERAKHASDRSVWSMLLTSVRIMGNEKLKEVVLAAIGEVEWNDKT